MEVREDGVVTGLSRDDAVKGRRGGEAHMERECRGESIERRKDEMETGQSRDRMEWIKD